MTRRFLGILPGLLPLLLCVPARAQMESREAIELQNQILELRRDMQSMPSGNGSMVSPQAPQSLQQGGGSDLTPQLLERVQTLEDQVRTLRGQVDELQNSTQRQTQDLSKQLGDLNFQMQQGAASDAAKPPAATTPPAGTLAPPAKAKPPAPAKHTHESLFDEGRRHYAAHDYQQAALSYDDAYNKSPSGGRAQDSLLGLAASLYSLGDKSAACGALNRLHRQFPATRPDIRQNAAALRGKAGC